MSAVRLPSMQLRAERRLPAGAPLSIEVDRLDVARAMVWTCVKAIAVCGALVVAYAAVALP